VIFVLVDGTVIIKKASGESVIMGTDNKVQKIDKFGQIMFKQNDQEHLHYDLAKINNKDD